MLNGRAAFSGYKAKGKKGKKEEGLRQDLRDLKKKNEGLRQAMSGPRETLIKSESVERKITLISTRSD